MTREKHTPGPWSLNIEDGRAEVCVDGERLTDPYIGDENARLIAAAPELLAALKAATVVIQMMERTLGMGDEVNAALDKRVALIDAAIAKAEGRS